MPAEHEIQPLSGVAAIAEKSADGHRVASIVSAFETLSLYQSSSQRVEVRGSIPDGFPCAIAFEARSGCMTDFAASRDLPVAR
jgi:hypothetical protein